MKNWQIYKKAFLMGVCFTLGITATAIVAVTVSATFTSGDTLTAANLNAIKNAIESIPDWAKSGNDAVYTTGNAQVGNSSTSRDLAVYGKVSSTTLGTFCGVTASTYNGAAVGGYTGAKSKCETACADPRAHMCTTHELIISAQLGVDMSTMGSYAYFSSELSSVWDSTAGYVATNCLSWTSDGTGVRALAASWSGTYGFQTYGAVCAQTFKLACCR